jgi:hypothetical protein
MPKKLSGRFQSFEGIDLKRFHSKQLLLQTKVLLIGENKPLIFCVQQAIF